MSRHYSYKAVTRDGLTRQGVVEAADEDAAVRELRAMGYMPLSLKPGAGGARLSAMLEPLRRRRSTPVDRVDFTRALSVLLSAGIELGRALAILAETHEDAAQARQVEALLEQVRGGQSFSRALGESGGFPDDYVRIVENAELSGQLAPALEELAGHLERARAMRNNLVSVLIYPAILLLVALVSIVVMLVVVVPQFMPLFEEMGDALPASTALVLALAGGLQAHGLLLLGVLALLLLAARLALRRPPWRRWLDRRLLTLPLVGPLLRTREGARFLYSLGMLLENGIALGTALEPAVHTVRNQALRESLEQVRQRVREGDTLAQQLLARRLFPSVALQILKVGEETGRLGAMAERAGRLLNERAELRVRRMVTLVEPLLIVVLGVLIAAVVISLFVGIISVNELPI